MNNASRSAALVIAGMAAGVTLGLLFAPKKGKENREKLAKSLIGLRDAASDQIDNILSATNDVIIALRAKNDLYEHQHDDIENAII